MADSPAARPRASDGVAKLPIPPASGGPAFVLVALLTTGILGAAVVGLNIAVDPRDQWGTPLGYQPLVVPDPYEQKLLQYHALAQPPGTVILGASRAAALDPASVVGVAPGDGFNMALSGAGGEDVFVVLRWLLAHDQRLSHLVLDLDAFSLIQGRRAQVYASPAYPELVGKPAPGVPVLGRLYDAATAGALRDSVKVLRLTYVDGYPEPRFSFDADGLRHEPANDRLRAAGQFDLEAVVAGQYTTDMLALYAGQNRAYDPVLAQQYVTLLGQALARGVNVTLFFPPYSPPGLERLAALPDPFLRVRDMVQSFTSLCASGLRLEDFTEGKGIGLDPAGFYDGHHMTPENGRVLLQAMGRDAGEMCPHG